MTSLRAETRIVLADPAATIAPLCAHLEEHGAEISRDGARTVLRFGGHNAVFEASGDAITIVAESPDLAGLLEMRKIIAGHVREYAPADAPPAIIWTGDGVGTATAPDFRLLTVTALQDVTPHMRRIHLAGEDLARFDRQDALHVRLYLPQSSGQDVRWPSLGEDGLPVPVPEENRPVMRKYTIRAIDAAAGTLAIDFVLHEDAGPGSAFAARAQVGDRIGMAGPGGRGLQPAGRYVFLADETGLPAVARMLASLPADAAGTAMIEVQDEGEEQNLAAPAGIALRWLHRGTAEAGTVPLLQQAFDALELPADGPDLYLWGAMEHEAFRHVRAAARQRLRAERDKHLVVSYWRRGLDDEQHMAEKRAARAEA
ncbi:siderophore-interacting protein [Bosea sp. TWI1241]|uniref:siderophore-interacting protein n=1 Tax=Bosea sp. TWI1241 TaxID=3148904 RepID=UPI003207D636